MKTHLFSQAFSRLLAGLIVPAMLLSGCFGSPPPDQPESADPPAAASPSAPENDGGEPASYFRAFWVASVYQLDYPSEASVSAKQLAAEADEILDFAERYEFDAVILQIRPDAAALYPSELFPWSRFLTGAEGQAPEDGFDPLAYFIEGAHKRGLELHGWINPYRITRGVALPKEQALDALSDNHPARLHPEWVAAGEDGHLYFDPGLPDVRELIVGSVDELLDHYPLDGIHFDDYFYPQGAFDDDKTFTAFGAPGQSLADFRRESVTALIRTVSERVRQEDGCRFGVSPFGIWANSSSLPGGSDTRGLESYFAHFADSLGWIRGGLIDYIVPQLYWARGHEVADYATLLDWWCGAVRGTNVSLYIGQAAHLAMNPDESSVWHGEDELAAQLTLNASYPEVEGSVFFRYRYLAGNPSLAYTAAFAGASSEAAAGAEEPLLNGNN